MPAPAETEGLAQRARRLIAEIDRERLRRALEWKYRADQLRDDLGRFADEGGGGGPLTARAASPKLRGTLPAPKYRDILHISPKMSYSMKDHSIIIPSEIEDKLDLVGKEYTLQTGETMTVTSGTRTVDEQAAAMYRKIGKGTGNQYTNKEAFEEIRQEYNRGLRNGYSRDTTQKNMADVIKYQVARGVYISRHLRDGAVDIRVGSGARQENILKHLLRQHGGPVLREDDHLHVQFGR